RLTADFGQRQETFALASGHDNSQNPLRLHSFLSPILSWRAWDTVGRYKLRGGPLTRCSPGRPSCCALYVYEVADVYGAPGEFPSTFHPVDRRSCSHWCAQRERDGGCFLKITWPLCGILVFALLSATGHAAEEGSGGERAKEPSRTVEPKKKQDTDEPKKKLDTDEPKKKQDTDTKTESNGKQGAD